jgi:hypothetical protein
MLTKENFQDTWGRPKIQTKYGEMVVEMSTNKGEIVEVEMAESERVEKRVTTGGNVDTRISKGVFPMFSFQRRGIGAVKGKSWHKPKQKKDPSINPASK